MQSIHKGGMSSSKFQIKDHVNWCLPPTKYCKVNFDGSKLPNGKASFEFVIRDSGGNFSVVWC